MEQDRIKDKALYFAGILSMCILLVSVAYFFFLRTIQIDLQKSISLHYTGENGMASFRFDWTYADNLWKLKSGDIQIFPDITLEDGGNIYITPMLIVESSEDFYDFPDGLRLDIIKNYFEN